jgi:Na+/proline symporter
MIASIGTTLGGLIYLLFASIPLILAYSAFIIDPAGTSKLMEIDSQLVLPKLILSNTSDWIQILFFGSLVSVILSTAAGTLLAPGVLFTQNIVKYVGLELGDKNFLKATRVSILLFMVVITIYAMSSNETIHKMVENAYRVTLAGAFVPLVFGIFWKKANSQGAGLAITLGIFSWLFLEFFFADLIIEPQLVGLVFSFIGMIVGSLFIEKVK